MSLSVKKIFKIGEYLAKLQARTWLSHALCVPGDALLNIHETTMFLFVTLPNIHAE